MHISLSYCCVVTRCGLAMMFRISILLLGWVTVGEDSECPFILVSSFGVYLSLTFIRLSLRARVRRSLGSLGIVSGCVPCFSWILLATCFIAFIDPAIDRRIIYNDFRSNPYLYFDVGLVPRALGVQLGEFHLLVCLFTVIHLLCFIHALLHEDRKSVV